MADQPTANTYAKLFPEQLVNTCSADAPEANSGPIAYLHALYQEALKLEQSSTASSRLTLAQRRPDLGELLLDPGTLEQPVSALSLAIRALERQAQTHAGANAVLTETLANAGQHALLPFHFALEQTKVILKHKKIPYFELLQQLEYSYPSFCQGRLRTEELRQVMRNATGFSPALQSLLLDQEALRPTGNAWRAWYGLANSTPSKAIETLLDVETYCRKTGLNTEQLFELLAISGIDDNAQTAFSAVKCSSAYRPKVAPSIDGLCHGAVYINANRKTPLTVKDVMTEPGLELKFDQLDHNCLARMYQMIHLQRALALPFADVDLLLISILRAEGQTGNWRLSPCTLRAMGVFLYLNEAYSVSAEQFAALVWQVTPFSVGEQLPLLDRVLDGPGAGQNAKVEMPLVLDERTFDPDDKADGQRKLLPGLCLAMGTDEQTTRAYLEQARQALKLKTLVLSLPLVSSLYRLSRLPRLLKRSPLEAMALLKLLDLTGCALSTQLAGSPRLSDTETTDTLDGLVALTNLDGWLRQEHISPLALLEALSPGSTNRLALDSPLVKAMNERLPHIREALESNDARDLSGGGEQQQAQQNTAGPNTLNDHRTALAANLLVTAFRTGEHGFALSQEHIPPLMRWCALSPTDLLADILAAAPERHKSIQVEHLDAQRWLTLARHAELIRLLRLSPAAITTLIEHTQAFDLEETEPPKTSSSQLGTQAPVRPPANLDLCYQLGRFRDWVDKCRGNLFDESSALDYLSRHSGSTEQSAIVKAAQHLGSLIGWRAEEVELACPLTLVAKPAITQRTRPSLDDFIATLSVDEQRYFNSCQHGSFFFDFVNRWLPRTAPTTLTGILNDKLSAFLEANPGALLVTTEQYNNNYFPQVWTDTSKYLKANPNWGYFPLVFEALPDTTQAQQPDTWSPCVPNTISDIDWILRLQALCEKTGLSCQSLLDLGALCEVSPYSDFQGSAQLLLAGIDDARRESVERHMREAWRDALTGYLMAHWAPSKIELSGAITTPEDLSSYCLVDIQVNSEVGTTRLNQAIGSLQHYLYRLYAHLEPGYEYASPSVDDSTVWNTCLGQYGTWKQRQQQINHPENLIYYANRPNKSVAFQALEVELNQGKLDETQLHKAICSYLTQFERLSNLQVVSGYLDGHDPKNDTYHFIGKTNSTPTEYYWRTLDMRMRDDKQRLSPLAWSEWEKITLPVQGEIPQSSYKTDATTHTCDAIRPVVIQGRRYVFWVERGVMEVPDGDNVNKTVAKTRKLTVQYAYQQSDCTWSPGNELLCLDGYKDGKWLGRDIKKNNRLKTEDFTPGLIVFVYDDGERAADPWLAAILYDCNKLVKSGQKLKKEDAEKSYFVELRDLLLIDKKIMSNDKTYDLCNTAILTHEKTNKIQHKFDGRPISINETSRNLFVKLGENLIMSCNLLTSTEKTEKTEKTAPDEFTTSIIHAYKTGHSETRASELLQVFDKPKLLQFISAFIEHYNSYDTTAIANILYDLYLIRPKDLNKLDKLQTELYNAKNNKNEEAQDATQSAINSLLNKISSKTWSTSVEIDNSLINIYLIDFSSSQKTATIRVDMHRALVDYLDFIHDSLHITANRTHSTQPLNTDKTIAILNTNTSSFEAKFSFSELGSYTIKARTIPLTTDDYDPAPYIEISSTIVLEDFSSLDEAWAISLNKTSEQAQFLDLTTASSIPPMLHSDLIRLNTLFGKQLVARAEQGVEAVLGWDTQCLLEPNIEHQSVTTPLGAVQLLIGPQVPLDLHGANGLYFRELFLHLPALIANRLTEQQQFEEAESWYLRYLFDPYRTQPDETGRPAPWCTRPLQEVGTLSSRLEKDVAPIVHAFVQSRYYQQAIYLSLLENWQLQGDHYYRQLTLSTLNQAWLCYQQALRLLGPLPERADTSRWKAVPLADLNDAHFRRPLNNRVTELRKTLKSRVHNLRHGLTLDGKALPALGWSGETLDAFSAAKGGLSILPNRYNSDRAPIPAYRFRQLLPLARAAAQQLLDFGRHYMSLMEEEFNTSLSVQLKAQEVGMSDFAIRIQREAISSIQAKKNGLEISRGAAKAKHAYLSRLIDVGRSPEEEAATALTWTANSAMLLSIPFQLSAAIVGASVPTIYGMAVGGNKPEAPMINAAMGLHTVADASKMASDELLLQAGYNRRANEWAFDRGQTEWDLKLIEQQLTETNIELNAATIALAQYEQERTNLEEAYVSMTTGFTIIPVYNWLVARQQLIYGAAYDAVLSLCLSTEAAWRYEIGDYQREAFIKTSAWSDTYKGMLVGESLLLDLQQMENAYLLANERRLTIKKSFVLEQEGSATEHTLTKSSSSGGSLAYTFEFKARDFDRNYPGHYLRQIQHVSVSLELESGLQLDDLCAILTQTGSTTLLVAEIEGAKALYPSAGTTSPAKDMPSPKSIARNPRAHQQIALSTQTSDDGMAYATGNRVYQTLFHDGRYLPFEGTGAISEWKLEIMNNTVLAQNPSKLKKVTFNIVYSAKPGGEKFTSDVRALCESKST